MGGHGPRVKWKNREIEGHNKSHDNNINYNILVIRLRAMLLYQILFFYPL